MKIRAHECRNCAHLWASPVGLSKNAVGISGESAVYCPRCNSRDVNSGPHQDTGIPESEWEWFGKAGHFICSNDCRFHFATKVGDYFVSTVGEYLPPESAREILAESRGIKLRGKGDARLHDFMQKCGYEDIGYNRKYETMVFRILEGLCSCGCGQPRFDICNLLVAGHNSAGDANNGHLEMCRKVAAGWKPGEEEEEE